MASKYLDAYLQQKASKKKDEENKSTSSTGRGAGSAAASGRQDTRSSFLARLQNETKNLYSQQSGPSGTPAPTAPNLYAAAAQRMTPGLTGAQRQALAEQRNPAPATPNLYSQAAQRMMPTGDTWEDTQALGRELTPRMTYSQYLARNMDTAASGGEVTPQMQAELQRAEQADREYKERRRQARAEINASGPLSESANPDNWSGDAALYLQVGGDVDLATVRGLDNVGRRFLGEAAGSVRNTINEAGYLYQAERELMKDPTKGPNIQEQLLYEFTVDPHAMDAYNEWKAGLKPGEYEALEMAGQLPDPGTLYVQQRLKEMEEKFQATYEEPELKRITNFGQDFQDETERLYGDMVGGWQTAGELAGTIGQQAPAMAARTIPVIGPALSSVLFFASAAGGSTEEAYAKGASLQGAVDYGVLSGAVEAATEKMFDGLGGLLGSGSADDLVEAFVGRFARSDVGRSTLRWLAGSVGEGVEEVVSDLLNPLISTVYNGKTVKESYKDLTFGEVLHDYILGQLTGGLLGTLSLANGQSRNANATLRQKAVAEAIEKWKQTKTFSAFLDAVGAVQSQTEADNLARGLENKNAPQTNLGAENAEGVLNNGEQTGEAGPYAASENGDDGVRAGEQVRLPGEGEGAQPGGQGEVRQGVSESRGENLRSVTLRELGVTDAAEGATIQVQDENSLTGDAAIAAQQVRQIGLEPVAFRGDMIVNGASVNGYIENGKVFFRTDAKYRDGTPIPPDAIVRHESVHNAKDADPGIIDTGMEIVRQKRSETEVQAMKDTYRETYKDLYDFEKMSEEEITNMLVEEIVADAYGGLNYFRDGGETVEQVRGAIGSRVENANTAENGSETRGPPRALAAGRNARTADSQSLGRAEEMEKNGSSNEEIRQETGWYRGRDGQWRFEIDDSGAKFYRSGDARFRKDHPEYARYQDLMSQFHTGSLSAEELMELQQLEQTWGREQGRLKEMVDSGRATLGMILDHEALFEAYPELREMRVRFADLRSGEKGYYDPKHNNLTISNELRNAPEDTLIHEIQHAVQGIEGFSGGASTEYWEDQERNGNVRGWKSEETRALEKEYQELLDSLPEETRQMIREVKQAYVDSDFDRIDDLEDQLASGPYGKQYFDLMELEGRLANQKDSDRKINAKANYLNTAGEIEARDAAARRNMTAEERKNTPPDLGDEDTVFAEGPETSYALRDKKIPTREELEAKEPIIVVDIREETRGNFKEQRRAFLDSEEAQRLYREPALNRDTNEMLFITPASITHTFSSEGQENILLAKHLREIAENAVLTHGEQSRKAPDDNTTGVYKFFGAVQTNDGVQPVKLTVKEYSVNGQDIPRAVQNYMSELRKGDTFATVYDGKVLVLEGIEKETSSSAASSTQGNPAPDNHPSVSTYSVKDLLDLVKGEDQKYIPQKAIPRASAEVMPRASDEDNQRPAYTVHDGVGKLFADQLDRLTETADRQGTYYDGVQEVLTDALLEAESEEDLDRILAGKDSDKFSYSQELTEKLWELRQLIDVNSEAQTRTESAKTRTESAQTRTENAKTETKDRRSLEQQLQELKDAYQAASDRNDTEFDYRGTLQKITELEKRVGENAPLQTAQSAASSPEGAPSAEDVDAARADLLDVGEATVRNDTGTYIMKVRLKGDRYQAQIFKNGKLDKSQSFPSAQEAADYAVDWVKGRTEGQTDAELDNERSEQREKPGPHWPTGKEYGEEIVRQKQNKAADAATQTLRERIRRAEAELQALRRLDRNTGLTDRQKARMNDIQETLDIMNDELTARKGRRAEKKNKAKQTPVTENKPTRSAAEAKNALMDLFHTAAGNRAEVGRQIESKLAEIAQSGRITEEGRQQLYDMLMDNGMVPKHAEETFREIRNWLRGTRIFVNEQERADLGDNFEDLRKRAWGAGIYLTNDLRDGRIDAINGQLADTFGENRFPTDNALSDMLENMIDLADKGKTTQQTMQEAVEGEARETGQSANEIYADMFNRMDETLRTFAEKAGLEVDLKNRTATQLAQERQRWEDRMERKAQARRESEIRGKVLRGLQRLSKLRGKAGPEIRADIDEVLQDIDTQARQITPAGLENLQDLQRAYEEARAAAGYVDGDNMGNWIPNPYVEEKLASLTKKHVNDMSLEEVVDLGRTVEALEHAIRTQNQMIGEEFDATIESYANGVRGDVESSKGAKPGFLHKWLKEEHLSPRRFLDMLGGWKTDGTMAKMSKSLEDGQTRMLDFQRRAVQSFDPFLSKKANRQWLEKASGKKAEWTKYNVLDGYSEDGGSYTEIELTPMMKISLYLHSRNMDNLRHIQTGGIVIPNKALYQQGKMAEAYAQGKRVKMNPETVRKIAGELTETERTFANHVSTVFDQISKDAINEVSLQLDGFERAGVENYMPIETDRNFLKSDVAGEARAATVEGIGSIANERIHASNPVMLSDASDVLMRQIDKVSRYYGYAVPIRNFQAVNNYVFHEEGDAFSTSIKEIVNKKWGSGAEQYITKMLEDLQSSGRRGDMMSSALAKLRGNLAGATLMFNPSVAVSQTASYPGAAQAVGWDGLAHGLVAGRVDPKLIEKYSPLYWYRNQGNSTQELGDYMSNKGLEQKLPWILNWIQKMDSATIRRLWAASEYRVSKDNPGLKPGSQADIDAGKDAYYQKVAEVFNRAVYDTQPNYTNMERAQILRSNSDVTKFLTMYKTVPLQYYGMMVEATGRLQAAMKSGDQAKIAQARKYAADTFGGLLAANTVYVAMKALFKGIRRKDKDYRDEEGNLTAGSVAAQLGKDLAETYAGSIIGGAEAFSAAKSLLTGSKFYGPEMSALSYVEDMVGAVNSVFKSIGDEDPRKAAGAIKDAAVTLAQGFGVPAKNMETYLMAAVRWTFPDVAMEYDNLFGGIERADMKGMDEQAVSTATNLILQNRTGLKIDKSVTDELARLYAAGENAAVPTETPSSFSYNGKTVQIADRGAYSNTWGAIVGDNLEELVTADDYVSADDGQRAALVNKLYQYATVEARRGADPEYSAEGNSTYGWTVKADEAVEAGVGLVDAICALDAFGRMTADKDENGNSISGSKKAKVCDYIDSMDITNEQKDVMYLLSGYKENSLEYTPWHGWDEDEEDGSGTAGSGKGSGKRSGKRSGGRGGSRKAAPKEKAVKGSGSKIQLPKAAKTGESGSGKAEGLGKGADASLSLIEIIDRYYDGNALAAAMDGGARARGRTTVDFEV